MAAKKSSLSKHIVGVDKNPPSVVEYKKMPEPWPEEYQQDRFLEEITFFDFFSDGELNGQI